MQTISTLRFVHLSRIVAVIKENNKKPKYNKRKFIAAFIVAMGFFACIRHGFDLDIPLKPSTAAHVENIAEVAVEETLPVSQVEPAVEVPVDTSEIIFEEEKEYPDSLNADTSEDTSTVPTVLPSSQRQHNGHRIIGVHSWREAFPDIQPVQLAAAKINGIHPCATREEAMRLVKRHKLVDITNSPFYVVDDLTHSMPYLVPKAQHLLNTICLNFIDSLQAKGMQPHLPMITSVLRTTDDVSSLQRRNRNATENSCHCYGTTVDITYNRFVPITGYYNPNQELTRWSLPFKQIMAEVLRDLREQGRCYVKYEYKQACFHLTVR